MPPTALDNLGTLEPRAKTEVDALIHLVGARVKEARKAQKLSRRALSETSGVSPRYLAKLEAGDGNASIGLLQKIALALQVPIEALLAQEAMRGTELQHIIELYQCADEALRARVLELLDPGKTHGQKAQRLCLVGLRGAGKSTLGAKIGTAFDVPFIELTTEIESRAGMPLAEIIALYGQEGYRKLEFDTLAEVIQRHNRAVVAVAGGIVSEADTFSQILTHFHTVWVKAAPSEHMERVRAQGDLRPMQGNPQAMEQLRGILERREAHYAKADHVLDTSGKTVERSLADLSNLLHATGLLQPRPSQ